MSQISSWTLDAKCQGRGNEMFVEPPEQKRVRSICFRCPVRAHCLAEALDDQIEWGVWGGKTERERRLILRQQPDVVSWKALLVDGVDTRAPQPLRVLAS